ncbi:hypothetical protein MIND_00820400 [Mycena indigotica]|uniref:F-box domain-containing protein n=1 Tax=Mycena indigotica TaxID=2126181 RepID=A0A8H6SG12_9AGAR|nr:uncharacterized protein MIND_00820400 [Mycena indigotica]KAF7298729.1 hypothetical protein MIND_00820400 [Mycena indigotica]
MAVSPFAAKLSTNFVPCDSELEEIRGYLAGYFAKLAELDSQIAQWQAKIDELAATRDCVKAVIGQHAALISPMRRVPEDILREIFLYCLAAEPVALVDARRAPMLLTHVCASWRHLAHAMPALWNSIHIPGGSFSQAGGLGDMLSFNAEVVAPWLNRTKGTSQLLSLSMSFKRPNQTWGLLLNEVFPRIRRLELKLESGDNSHMHLFLRQTSRELPHLECLKIDTKEDSGPNFWPTTALLGIPTLRSVSLRIRADPMKLPLPWDQLLELNLRCFFSATTIAAVFVGGLSVADALDLLRRCPRLRKCSLQITRGGQFQPRSLANAIELQDLAITDAIFLPQLLERIDAPNLQRLSLSPKIGREDDDRPAFLNAIQPHAANLTSVDFVITLFNTQTLRSFLAMVPVLRELVLRSAAARSEGVIGREEILENSILGSLTPMSAPDASVYCPLLTHVEFASCAQFSDWKLAEFIEKRMTCEVRPTLRSVIVSFERPMLRDIMPHISRFFAAGLRVQLEWSKSIAWRYDPHAGLCDL